jgi:hypothetical protein
LKKEEKMEFGNMTLSEAIDVLKKESSVAATHSEGITGMECRRFADAVDTVCCFIDRAVAVFSGLENTCPEGGK